MRSGSLSGRRSVLHHAQGFGPLYTRAGILIRFKMSSGQRADSWQWSIPIEADFTGNKLPLTEACTEDNVDIENTKAMFGLSSYFTFRSLDGKETTRARDQFPVHHQYSSCPAIELTTSYIYIYTADGVKSDFFRKRYTGWGFQWIQQFYDLSWDCLAVGGLVSSFSYNKTDIFTSSCH